LNVFTLSSVRCYARWILEAHYIAKQLKPGDNMPLNNEKSCAAQKWENYPLRSNQLYYRQNVAIMPRALMPHYP